MVGGIKQQTHWSVPTVKEKSLLALSHQNSNVLKLFLIIEVSQSDNVSKWNQIKLSLLVNELIIGEIKKKIKPLTYLLLPYSVSGLFHYQLSVVQNQKD